MPNMTSVQRQIASTGLTTIYEPAETEPVADIVFVHGLQGHPHKTWASKQRRREPVTTASYSAAGTYTVLEAGRSRSRNPLHHLARRVRQPHSSKATSAGQSYLKDDGNETDTIFWPGDLLPKDCPGARILTWGYDTIVTRGWAKADKSSLFAHARDLLYALGRQRPGGRKLIFVAHSLGGVMVKEVLRRSEASREPDIRDIIESTTAILFMGTPHRGNSDLTNLGELVRKIASTVLRVDSNASVLRSLGVDSPELELCRESFTVQWTEYNFRVKTFQEAFGLGGINVGRYNEKIVPDVSSLLDDPREHAETIRANHMEMVRFFGVEDPGYQKVVGELRKLLELLSIEADCMDPTVPQPVSFSKEIHPEPTTTQSGELSKDEKQCLQSLFFPQLGARQDSIKPELGGTCRWLLEHPTYLDWDCRQNVAKHHGLLWIKGRPGAGKSTLMKKTFQRAEECYFPESVVASYFFNARGAELERTVLGMFRSLLHQILQQDQQLRQALLPNYLMKRETQGASWEWRLGELQKFLLEAFSTKHPRRFYLFVDALDECAESEVREVVHYLRSLTDRAFERGAMLNICISSRRYPTISVPYCPEVDVEEGNCPDISKYVHHKISHHSDGRIPRRLADKVDRKASHIFLWAVLVVELLLRAWDRGASISELERQLESIPEQIEELFSQLSNTFNTTDRPEALSLFRWVLLAKEPLSVESLQSAIASTLATREHSTVSLGLLLGYKTAEMDIQRYAQRIVHFSRGLIEVTGRKPYSSESIVQVIHESVRDWFLRGDGFVCLDTSSVDRPVGRSHAAIVEACVRVLSCKDFLELHQLHQRATFTRYVVNHIFAHAQDADADEAAPIRLVQLLSQSQSRLWSILTTTKSKDTELQTHQREDPVLHFLCRKGLVAYVRFLLNDGTDPNLKGGPYCYALIAAIHGGHATVLRVLLEYQACATLKDAQGCTTLHHTALVGLSTSELIPMLLEQGVEIDARDRHGRTALMIATRSCHVEPLKILLSRGANPLLHDISGRRPLRQAVAIAESPIEIVKILLSSGAAPDECDEDGYAALHIAAKKANFGQLECLINALTPSPTLDVRDPYRRTALHLAVVRHHPNIVARLVDAGSDLNCVDKSGQTPLHLAAPEIPFAILQGMVQAGADRSIIDNFGYTAYDYAKGNHRHQSVVDVLDLRYHDVEQILPEPFGVPRGADTIKPVSPARTPSQSTYGFSSSDVSIPKAWSEAKYLPALGRGPPALQPTWLTQAQVA